MKALSYLIDNAISFTSKGRVVIRAKAAKLASPDECLLSLQVEDTGTGVAAGWEKRIFKAFQQVSPGRRDTGHLGLGLTVCENLTNLMGGSVKYHSGSKQGACFELKVCLRR